jgi:hypothetical protein
MRRPALLTLCFVTACGAASGSSGGAPPLVDRYSRALSARLRQPSALTHCQLGKLDLGPTEPASIRRFPLVLALPTAFAGGPLDLPIDSLWHPMLQARWGAQEWLPGFYIEPERHYRWSRVHVATAPGVDLPTTLFQLVVRRRTAYPLVQAQPPWEFAESEECLLTLPLGTARVLRFVLRHPTVPTQWGVIASWRLRPETVMGLLVLGPDASVQAEALHILQQVHR